MYSCAKIAFSSYLFSLKMSHHTCLTGFSIHLCFSLPDQITSLLFPTEENSDLVRKINMRTNDRIYLKPNKNCFSIKQIKLLNWTDFKKSQSSLAIKRDVSLEVMKERADNMDNLINSQNIATVASSEFWLVDFDNEKEN